MRSSPMMKTRSSRFISSRRASRSASRNIKSAILSPSPRLDRHRDRCRLRLLAFDGRRVDVEQGLLRGRIRGLVRLLDGVLDLGPRLVLDVLQLRLVSRALGHDQVAEELDGVARLPVSDLLRRAGVLDVALLVTVPAVGQALDEARPP